MKVFTFLLFFSVFSNISLAQESESQQPTEKKPKMKEANVFIDLGIKKYSGKINKLNREKFFGIQSSFLNSDLANEAPYLVNELDVNFAKDFNGPDIAKSLKDLSASQVNSMAKEFAEKNQKNIGFKNDNWVLTQRAENVYIKGPNVDFEKEVDKITKYLKSAYTNLPAYYDLMDEPLSVIGNTVNERRDIAFFYKQITKELKEEFPNIKFGGFSSKRPHFENDNFSNWENTGKLFFETAGDNFDYISLKLNDEITPQQTLDYCSGSNLEAILDLIETYSFNKWDKVKPFLITEFGLNASSWEGTEYVPARDTFTIESLNKILMALLDKPDRIEKAIPYVLGSATDFYKNKTINPEGNSHPLAVARKFKNGAFNYTHLIKFYEFWKDVKGERTYMSSDNPDVQVNAFLNEGKWYLVFNNLSDESQLIKFNFSPVDIDVITKYTLRRLYMNANGIPELTEASTELHVDQLDIDPNETFMLICDVPKNIEYATSIVEYNNYSNEYLKDIKANEPITFSFPKTKTGTGKAFIRLSFGREINKNLSPIVRINGSLVLTPKNWAGDNQKGRKNFFGTLNIPVPMSYVKEINEIEIKFPDSGGKISSVIINTEIFSDDVNNKNYTETNGLVYASHGGNLLNISEKIDCKNAKITDLEGNTIKKLKSYNNGDKVDISSLKGGEYYLDTPSNGKIKFKK